MVERERLKSLVSLLEREGLDAVFIAPSSDLTYITGLKMKSDSRLKGAVVTARGAHFFLCPAMQADDAEEIGTDFAIVPWTDHEGFKPAFDRGLAIAGLGTGMKIAFTRGIAAGDMLDAMRGLEATCVNGFTVISPLRSVKSPDELDRMRYASRMNDQMMDAVSRYIRPGVTETDIVKFVMNFHESQGGVPRVPGVATGPNSAKAHYARDNNRTVEMRDIVMIDSGGWYRGYSHDMTRTFFVGAPTDEQRNVYEIVRRAQQAAEDSVGIGSIPAEIDAIARNIIAAEGYGEAFTHRLGHGIGMDGHESPYISPANREPLVLGNCFSIEPGIYLKGKFGVRIENLVMLTAAGKEVINHYPKQLRIL